MSLVILKKRSILWPRQLLLLVFLNSLRVSSSSTLPIDQESGGLEDSSQSEIIPPYNKSASTVNEVYNVKDIILPSDLSAIPFKPFIEVESREDLENLMGQLKFTSKYVMNSLHTVLGKEEKNKKQIKVLLYLAYLFKFRTLKPGKLNDMKELSKALNDAPQVICENLINRFTEPVQDTFGKTK